MNFDIKTEQLSGDGYGISLTGEVDLHTAPVNITKIFEITGFDKVLTIHPTRDEAVAVIGVLQG